MTGQNGQRLQRQDSRRQALLLSNLGFFGSRRWQHVPDVYATVC